MTHGFSPLDQIRGHEWSEPVTDPKEVLDAGRAAINHLLNDSSEKLKAQAADWLDIIEGCVRDRLGSRMSGKTLALKLEQARTSMQLAAANELVDKERKVLAALQTGLLAAAKMAL